MESNIILVICIFNFFIYLYFFFHLTLMTLIPLLSFDIEQTLTKVDNEEDDVLTLDNINSCDIPSSSRAC
jgi:hypothetical protein